MIFDVVHDGLDQDWHVLKDTTLETLLIQVAKEALDDVQS